MTFQDNPYKLSRKPASENMFYFEGNFSELKTCFAGDNSPNDPVPFQLWGDTTNNVLRFLDHNGSYWHGLWHGDEDQVIWSYTNSTPDGYVLKSGSSGIPNDCVVAIKGGSTYTTGGSIQGLWEDVDLLHYHKWYAKVIWNYVSRLDLRIDDNGDEWVTANQVIQTESLLPHAKMHSVYAGVGDDDFAYLPSAPVESKIIQTASADVYYFVTSEDGGITETWRPKALVGILLGLDLS